MAGNGSRDEMAARKGSETRIPNAANVLAPGASEAWAICRATPKGLAVGLATFASSRDGAWGRLFELSPELGGDESARGVDAVRRREERIRSIEAGGVSARLLVLAVDGGSRPKLKPSARQAGLFGKG